MWVAAADIGGGFRRFDATPSVITREQMCESRVLSEIDEPGMGTLDNLVGALQADPMIGPA